MEKVITISGREVKLKSSAAFALRYKQQFRRDPLADIIKLGESATKVKPEEKKLEEQNLEEQNLEERANTNLKDMANLDFEVLYNVTWALAKNADKTIPEPIDFFDQFEEFPILDNIGDVFDLALTSMGTNIISKKK